MANFGEHRSVVLFGNHIAYQQLGDQGPVVVLLHGIADSGQTWDVLLPHLPTDNDRGAFTILAPDLLGHGRSAKPRSDYSLSAHANMLRNLLDALGHDQVIVVGHSLGGGVAMQFAHQYPERCRGLMLVATGGLGNEVAGLLRAAALPGAELVLRLLAAHQIQRTLGAVSGPLGRGLRPLRLSITVDIDDILRGYRALSDSEAQAAFLATLRSVVDTGGQRVSAMNWLSVAGKAPITLVWGGRDPIIPVRHAYDAHELIPHSELVIFPDAGHFPHRQDPRRFACLIADFVHALDRKAPQPVSVTPPRTPTTNARLRSRGDGHATGSCAEPAMRAMPAALPRPARRSLHQ
jgi:pimeloyl-ACP methyl ester carboxylesterase